MMFLKIDMFINKNFEVGVLLYNKRVNIPVLCEKLFHKNH